MDGVIWRGMVFGVLMYAIALVFATIRIACAHDYDARLKMCEPHRAQVEQILDEEGISRDYFYLMVAESGCRQGAVSGAGAHGFWQLMPKTARDYGCYHPHNLECATRAAARYIRHLESTFRSFDEVIAAYNMGGHNLRKHGTTRQARGLVYTVRQIMRVHK